MLKRTSNKIAHYSKKILHSSSSNKMAFVANLFFKFYFGFCIFIIFVIISSKINQAIWRWKIDNNKVVMTTAQVVDRKVITYSMLTGIKQLTYTTVNTCNFSYIYKVNGKTYRQDSSFEDNNSSICHHANNEIKIYYDPDNIEKSVSVNLVNEGTDNQDIKP